MSHDITPNEAEDKLWKAIEDRRFGMLSLDQPGEHAQPMTAFCERDTGSLWFFTYRDSDLAREAGEGGMAAMFSFISKDQKVFACMAGRLHIHEDEARKARFWNPVVAAWYPEGRDDPRVCLMHMKLEDARVWISEAGPIRFSYEIAKANLTDSRPDVGAQADIRFQ